MASDEAMGYAEKRIAEMQSELSFACVDEQRKDMKQELEQAYTQGRADAVQELETKARHWCMADPESSLVPKLSSWRLFDHLFIKLPGGEND